MTRTLIRGATMAGLVSFAVLAFAPSYALADDRERLSSAPSLSIAEHGFQVAQGKKQGGGGGGGGGQTCPAGYADCDGTKATKCETNIQTDANNCGACGKVCSFPNATGRCANGSCYISFCETGYSDCDKNASNGCEAKTLTDPNNCGVCGKVCSFPNATAACTNGSCSIGSCKTGYGDCDNDRSNGCETKVGDDVNNCGACGKVCGPYANATAACTNGICQAECKDSLLASYDDCDGNLSNGCETKVSFDENNCGACGKVCGSYPNAITTCNLGICGISSCKTGYTDCDGNTANGCEADLQTDLNNCGACGAVCSLSHATSRCLNGTCQIASCDTGYATCDGKLSTGCESNLNDGSGPYGYCGTCGQRCYSGTCVNGKCQ